MSKPWDVLRVDRRPAVIPMTPGSFYIGPLITLTEIYGSKCRIRFGQQGNSDPSFEPRNLRELAEFCTELADQLESQ